MGRNQISRHEKHGVVGELTSRADSEMVIPLDAFNPLKQATLV
jgi:hypothetical protein